MTITALDEQKGKKSRLNLFLDNKFYCGIEIGTAAKLGLYVGKEISDDLIKYLNSEEEYQKCLNSALRLASIRMQSEKEYWQKLGKKFSKPIIGDCLDRLRELGYADDRKFTQLWIKERSKKSGRRLLETELSQKGINKLIISEELDNISEAEELTAAINQGTRKFNPKLTRMENYKKIINLLTRKGFSYTVSKNAFEVINKATV